MWIPPLAVIDSFLFSFLGSGEHPRLFWMGPMPPHLTPLPPTNVGKERRKLDDIKLWSFIPQLVLKYVQFDL